MPLPNFFVVGAPKAGTTALYHALAQHPDIFMSPVKEPLYFACDGEPPLLPGPAGLLMQRRAIWRAAEYLALFAKAGAAAAIGEASVVYLRSPIAAARICKNVPKARIIAILRAPAERAHSHFWFSVSNGSEPLRDFEAAIAQEMSGGRHGWGSELHHWQNGFYHDQLLRYLDLFGEQQVLVRTYDEWRDMPDMVLADIFRFLRVDDAYRPDVPKANVTLPARQHGLRARLRHALTFGRNASLEKVPALRPETRALLAQSYREDVDKLEVLIERDLSSWR